MRQRRGRAGQRYFRPISPPERQRAPPIKRAGQSAFTPISYISHYNLYREVGSSREIDMKRNPLYVCCFAARCGICCQTRDDLRKHRLSGVGAPVAMLALPG